MNAASICKPRPQPTLHTHLSTCILLRHYAPVAQPASITLLIVVCRWAAVKCFWDTGRQISSTTAATSFIKRSSPVKRVMCTNNEPATHFAFFKVCLCCYDPSDISGFPFLLCLILRIVFQWCVAGWPDSVFIAGCHRSKKRSAVFSASCRGQRTWGCERMTSWSSKMHPTFHEKATDCAAMATAFSTPLATVHPLVRGLSRWARKRISPSGGELANTYTAYMPSFTSKDTDTLIKILDAHSFKKVCFGWWTCMSPLIHSSTTNKNSILHKPELLLLIWIKIRNGMCCVT